MNLKSCVDRSFIKFKPRNISIVIKYVHNAHNDILRVDVGKDSIVLNNADLSAKEIIDYFNAEFERIGANLKME